MYHSRVVRRCIGGIRAMYYNLDDKKGIQGGQAAPQSKQTPRNNMYEKDTTAHHGSVM